MTVRDYYTKHLEELSPAHQYLFMTTIKNWFKTDEFDDELDELDPPEKSDLFHEDLSVDKRKEDFYAHSDELLSPSVSLASLTTDDLDYIFQTELRFPRRKNVFALITQKCLHFTGDPAHLVRLATHTIISDSDNFTRDLTESSLPLYRPLLTKCAKLISQNLTSIPLKPKLDFLIASKLVHVATNPSVNAIKNLPATYPQAPTGFLPLAQKIQTECQSYLKKSPFLLDPREPSENTPDSATPRNLSYILSGLDEKP